MVYKLESPFYRWEHNGKVEYYYANEKDKIDFSIGKLTKLKGLGSSSIEETKRFMLGKDRRLIQLVYNEFNEFSVEESSKLLYSTMKRKQLMIDNNVIDKGL
jgi:hypothetical protein